LGSNASLCSVKKVVAATCMLLLTACGESEPQTVGTPPDMRRLTTEQYYNIIHDIFGSHIQVAGRFDPLVRTQGLFAVGARSAPITPAGFEEYYNVARAVARQVVTKGNREVLLRCAPVVMDGADETCARQFFTEVGRFLYRRALTSSEIDTAVLAANEVAVTMKDFYKGIEFSLTGLLVSPSFLFIIDSTEPLASEEAGAQLTAYAKASRLSFLLWNTSPDDMLLIAAETGELNTNEGLQLQVERMIASPLLERGISAFFQDFLDLDKFETLEKDTIIYPAYSIATAESAKEQLLRTIIYHVVEQDSPYPELFTTRKTFIDHSLGRIYKLPVNRPDGGWQFYEFPENDPRTGILTQMAFLSLYSHPGRSSATLRGKAVRELVLCQKVPEPPGDVDFSLFNDPDAPNRTARDRLSAHSTVPSCAGCHKLTDPIGLGFEEFDGIGQFRTSERDVDIDPAGELDGVAYEDAKALAQTIRDHPAAPACVANQLYAYGTGRGATYDEREFMVYLQKQFADSGYSLVDLLRDITTSSAFYAVRLPQEESSEFSSASVGSSSNQERGS